MAPMNDDLWGPLIAQRLLMDALDTAATSPKRACIGSLRQAAEDFLGRAEPELRAAGEYIANLAASFDTGVGAADSLARNVFGTIGRGEAGGE
jgi:hypothetical protein